MKAGAGPGAPLAGATVVVTRAREQAGSLVGRLEAAGASVVELPVIAIEDPDDGGAGLARAAQRLQEGAYDWVVCTSANAATRLAAALGGATVPDGVGWAAVGPGTGSVLERAGYPPDLVPERSIGDALAEWFPEVDRAGGTGRVLFPRAEVVRPVVADGLRSKGWIVDEVVAYRTVPGDPGPGAREAASGADAAALTASSTVEHLVRVLGREGVPPLVVTIGPVTSDAARAAGLEVAAEADPHDLDGLLGALVTAWRAHRAGAGKVPGKEPGKHPGEGPGKYPGEEPAKEPGKETGE